MINYGDTSGFSALLLDAPTLGETFFFFRVRNNTVVYILYILVSYAIRDILGLKWALYKPIVFPNTLTKLI